MELSRVDRVDLGVKESRGKGSLTGLNGVVNMGWDTLHD